jgi:two-component system NtrC family sensor kinase
MDPTLRCIRCGEPTPADGREDGEGSTCARCAAEGPTAVGLEETSGSTPAAGEEPSPGFFPYHPAGPTDRMLTRSMLLPLPGMQAVPPDALIGRLEPPSLRWIDLSDALQRFLGRDREQLVNQSILQDVHADDRALAEEELRQACEHGERHDLVLRLRGRSGQWHFLRISCQARYEPDGRVHHIRCNLRDVTDHVRAEHELRRRTDKLLAANEELRRINRELEGAQARLVHTEKLAALGTMAAGMAHEINNPLAFALNNLAVLRRDAAEMLGLLSLYHAAWTMADDARPEVVAAIEAARDEVDLPYLEESVPRLLHAAHAGLIRVARVVERLRDFARLDRAPIGDLHINESIEQCLILLSEDIARLRIAVDGRPGELPPLQAVAADLNQALFDLLSNAIAAIEESGRPDGQIVIATAHAGEEIVVEIRDNGVGIPPEALPRIFDPFFTTRPIGQGRGLGLSVTHAIVAGHGGRIEVESNPGSGCCFRLVLPIGPSLAAGTPPP